MYEEWKTADCQKKPWIINRKEGDIRDERAGTGDNPIPGRR
jgi:hypothetical protein